MRQTAAAGAVDRVAVYRAFVTGDVNDLNDVIAVLQNVMYPFLNDRAFLVHTAPHRRLFALNDLMRDIVIAVVHIVFQHMACHRLQNLVFQLLNIRLKRSHSQISFLSSSITPNLSIF